LTAGARKQETTKYAKGFLESYPPGKLLYLWLAAVGGGVTTSTLIHYSSTVATSYSYVFRALYFLLIVLVPQSEQCAGTPQHTCRRFGNQCRPERFRFRLIHTGDKALDKQAAKTSCCSSRYQAQVVKIRTYFLYLLPDQIQRNDGKCKCANNIPLLYYKYL
jgi:hypothetical protein